MPPRPSVQGSAASKCHPAPGPDSGLETSRRARPRAAKQEGSSARPARSGSAHGSLGPSPRWSRPGASQPVRRPHRTPTRAGSPSILRTAARTAGGRRPLQGRATSGEAGPCAGRRTWAAGLARRVAGPIRAPRSTPGRARSRPPAAQHPSTAQRAPVQCVASGQQLFGRTVRAAPPPWPPPTATPGAGRPANRRQGIRSSPTAERSRASSTPRSPGAAAPPPSPAGSTSPRHADRSPGGPAHPVGRCRRSGRRHPPRPDGCQRSGPRAHSHRAAPAGCMV